MNRTQNTMVASRVKLAKHFFQRLKGLLGRECLQADEGLWIPHCQGVHTWGMRFWIDVVYLDGQGRIIQLESFLRPNRAGTICWKSKNVLELAPGKINEADLRVDEVLELTGG